MEVVVVMGCWATLAVGVVVGDGLLVVVVAGWGVRCASDHRCCCGGVVGFGFVGSRGVVVDVASVGAGSLSQSAEPFPDGSVSAGGGLVVTVVVFGGGVARCGGSCRGLGRGHHLGLPGEEVDDR